MLQIVNDTPFPAQLGLFVDHEGYQSASVVLKATLEIPGDEGTCRPTAQQQPVLPEPTYTGEAGQSSIRYPTDLVPTKPGTDVVFIGCAYTPGRRQLSELSTYLQVGPLRKSLTVLGDRKWVSSPVGSIISKPVPFERMPIVYERAYGGRSPSRGSSRRAAVDERNPVGTGFCASRRDVPQMRLPNLEDPHHRISSWRHRPPVAGLGAVDAHWLPRRQLAGTYDARWRAYRCPVLPRDFDPRFHCVGSDGLRSSKPLRGEVEVTLVHLTVDPVLRFRLPSIQVGMDFYLGSDLVQHEAELWTIVLEPDDLRVMMVWGANCRTGKRPASLGHVEITTEGA